MPSGPKKRARAKKLRQQQQLGSKSDGSDGQSQGSAESTSPDASSDSSEDISAPSSPLGKDVESQLGAQAAAASHTEDWVKLLNFSEVPEPTQEQADDGKEGDSQVDAQAGDSQTEEWDRLSSFSEGAELTQQQPEVHAEVGAELDSDGKDKEESEEPSSSPLEPTEELPPSYTTDEPRQNGESRSVEDKKVEATQPVSNGVLDKNPVPVLVVDQVKKTDRGAQSVGCCSLFAWLFGQT